MQGLFPGEQENRRLWSGNAKGVVPLRIYFPRQPVCTYTYEGPHTSEHRNLISCLLFVTCADFKFSFVFGVNSADTYIHACA